VHQVGHLPRDILILFVAEVKLCGILCNKQISCR